MSDAEVGLHCFATNPLYRVRRGDGSRYILRMGYPGWRSFDDLRSEASWLVALDRDTDVGAPVPLPNSAGHLVTPVTGPGVPGTWNATMMTWVEGRSLEHHLTPGNLEEFGRLFARLHMHGASWEPPEGFTTRVFRHYLSRGEPERIYSDECLDMMGPDDRRAFLMARETVELEYGSLDPGDIRVIHCDLWHGNVRVHRGRLRPFDFEDTVWGFRLHDIAMGMLDLLETVGGERYSDLLPAFRQGYESIITWPDGSMEILQMGRMLWSANWVARFDPVAIPDMARSRAASFRRLLDTGELVLKALDT